MIGLIRKVSYEKKDKKRKRLQTVYTLNFTGYEHMLEDSELNELKFSYLNEETLLTRDENQRIHFTTRDLPKK